ncbi:hypothetical protein JCM6882_007583 [Rhodosporidiobolus microsporus]
MGPFPSSEDWEGNKRDFIFSILEVATGRVKLIPCNQTITAEGAASLFLDHVYKDWGVPDKIFSVKPFIPNDEELFPNRIVDSVPLFPLDALDDEANYLPFPCSPGDDMSTLFDPTNVQGIWTHHVHKGALQLGYTTQQGGFRWVLAGLFGFDDSHPKVMDYLVKYAGRAGSI